MLAIHTDSITEFFLVTSSLLPVTMGVYSFTCKTTWAVLQHGVSCFTRLLEAGQSKPHTDWRYYCWYWMLSVICVSWRSSTIQPAEATSSPGLLRPKTHTPFLGCCSATSHQVSLEGIYQCLFLTLTGTTIPTRLSGHWDHTGQRKENESSRLWKQRNASLLSVWQWCCERAEGDREGGR